MKRKHPWNVLIFPAATEIGLGIFDALRNCKEAALFGADIAKPTLADFCYKKLYNLPLIHEPNFMNALNQLIADLNIDAIFPASDDACLSLAEKADRLSIPVITSPFETCRIARSKRLTYEALGNVVPIPEIFAKADNNIAWPCFVKPDCGQGSLRARHVNDFATLQAALEGEPDLLTLEYLPGTEYTVDCFSHPVHGLLYAQARERIQTKAGISVQTQPVRLREAWDYAARISKKMVFHGAWFFQVKYSAKGELKLLEIAPRLAGSMVMSYAFGPNLPLLSLYAAMGCDITAVPVSSSFRVRLGRSLNIKFIDERPIGALYMDYDDTLITHGRVNTQMIALIFNCRNRGIPVILISRHSGELEVSLAKYGLTNMFDRIIHIPDPTMSKAQFIKEDDAVLIDDSFGERNLAIEDRGIRCFDSATAICLIDERI